MILPPFNNDYGTALGLIDVNTPFRLRENSQDWWKVANILASRGNLPKDKICVKNVRTDSTKILHKSIDVYK